MLDYFTKDVGKRHICLLYGLGGSGKTQTALKFISEVDTTRYALPIQGEYLANPVIAS
jgi:Cdc6-like AAA superfamily ATPase